MPDPMPDFISAPTIARLRVEVRDLPEFEPLDYEGIENDLWRGEHAHPEWREANLPHRREEAQRTCMLCSGPINGWAVKWSVPVFDGPEMSGWRWWRDITIHLECPDTPTR